MACWALYAAAGYTFVLLPVVSLRVRTHLEAVAGMHKENAELRGKHVSNHGTNREEKPRSVIITCG